MQDTKATIMIADRNISLLMEVKDDLKQNFFEAIGLSTYSNSRASVLSYISIFENLWKVTELLEEISSANQKLQKQDSLQKEFIHIAAHELRNPIQPILAISQILKEYINKYYKEQNNLLDVIYRNSKRLEKLSRDILDLTRIESNTIQLRKEKFNLDEFLDRVVMDYRYSLEKYHHVDEEMKKLIDLKFLSLSNDVRVVECDKERLNQIIFNLLDNAYRFTKEIYDDRKGEIIVSCNTYNNDYAVVKVKDNGPGIDNEILPRLFTKFTSRSKNGTGLGLFICKNVIESFGGIILIENDKYKVFKNQQDFSKYDSQANTNNNNNNKGTTIAFSIPLVDSYSINENNELKKGHTSDANSDEQNNKKKKKILIIDDEYDLAMTYKIGLEVTGFIVDTYNDPIEALSKFIPNYYDLLLIDIRMPEMNGFEFYNKIKKKDENAKVCFISAYDMDNSTLKQTDLLSSKEKENKCIIKKPIEIDGLIDLVNKKIDKDGEIDM